MPFKRFISAPPRAKLFEKIIILLIVLSLTLVLIFPRPQQFLYGTIALLIVAVLMLLMKTPQAAHLALMCGLWLLFMNFEPLFGLWLVNLFGAIISYSILVFCIPLLRRSFGWFRPGYLRREIIYWVFIISCISILALIGWYFIFKPDLSKHLKMLPQLPLWLYPLAGLGFALANAFAEEFICRGVIMQALDGAVGAGIIAILLQGIFFGALHYAGGFPNGVVGFMLAAIYGIMLGFIRRKARGMLAPWLAHVLADATIFIILTCILLNAKH